MSDEQVAPGERVLTSGGDQIFPKGLPIGTVTTVSTGKDLFLNIGVKPAVNLSKLEEVLVVVDRQERQAATEDVGRERAVDIMARRLPSVPDKPVTNATGVATASTGSATTPHAPSVDAKPPLKTESNPQTGTAARQDSSVPKPISTSPAAASKQTVQSGRPVSPVATKPASAPTVQPKPSTTPATADPADTQDSPH
jgi:rod shape-determining protein MreC